MEEWIGGWTEEGRINKWREGQKDGYMEVDRWMSESDSGWMGGWMGRRWVDGQVDGWIAGWMGG